MLNVPLVARSAPLALELLACAALGLGMGGTSVAIHVLATALVSLVTLRATPDGGRRRAALATAALAFTLPLVGAAIVVFVAWPTWTRRLEALPAGTIEISLPSVNDDGDNDAEAPMPAREQRPIRELLGEAPGGISRVDAVMALRHMDARRAVPLLRLAFSHPSEDVRLLAFAILERREKRLRAGIRALERRLAQLESRSPRESCEQPRWRAQCHRRLAQSYWELCYGGFVGGALEIEALERAARHALSADAEQGDAATALLLARIHLRQRKAAEAWQCLERAELAGAHRGSSVPLFAEAAYALRRFDEIPRLLRRMERPELCRPDLAEVAQFWTEPRLT
jgi:hypothetical protein